LPEHYRDVIKRRYYGDQTPTQIACMLGRSVPSIKNRLRRALARLDGLLQGLLRADSDESGSPAAF
jgi:DNA-directed RNA polymerase specialized sigma24 family protein